MVAAVTPGGDVMEAAALETLLAKAGCTKTDRRTDRTCIWRAPNGRHFSAPDPRKVYLVPTRSKDRIEQMLAALQKLAPPQKAPAEVVPIPARKSRDRKGT